VVEGFNLIHACAISHVQEQDKLNTYIICMMEQGKLFQDMNIQENGLLQDVDILGKPMLKEISRSNFYGRRCARGSVDWAPILACTENKEGSRLVSMHGDDSNSLEPSMTFVPTVIIDGIRWNGTGSTNLFELTCRAYKGNHNPIKFCKHFLPR
jgi:hypothetical protein